MEMTATEDTQKSRAESTEAENQTRWNAHNSTVKTTLFQLVEQNQYIPIAENITTTPPMSSPDSANASKPMSDSNVVNKELILRYDSKKILIAPNIKSRDKLVIAVVSAPSNLQQRMEIRKSWRKDALNSSYGITVLFFLGKSSYNDTTERKASAEASVYGDIVQLDFEDSYRNLTLKAYGIIRWFSLYTINAQYLLKVDDDTYVNIERLVGMLPPTGGSGKQLKLLTGVGRMRVQPVRDMAAGERYVAESDYPEPTYPPYLSGGGYLLSRDAAVKINNACRYVTSSLPVEDVLITGLCANIAGVRRRHDPSFRAALNPPGHHCVYYHRVLVAQVKTSMVGISHVLKSPQLASFDCSKHY